MPSQHWKEAAEYAEDMARYDVPWLWWEMSYPDEMSWVRCTAHPNWDEKLVYRRRPRTIRIGEYDVPEPMREAPKDGVYYIPALEECGERLYIKTTWDNDCWDEERIMNGLCHLTAEAAELHAKALLSFTRRDDDKQ